MNRQRWGSRDRRVEIIRIRPKRKEVTVSPEEQRVALSRFILSADGFALLKEAETKKLDGYRYVVAKAFKKPIEDVTEAERCECKNLFFAYRYGRGGGSLRTQLSQATPKQVEQVQTLVDEWKKNWPALDGKK